MQSMCDARQSEREREREGDDGFLVFVSGFVAHLHDKETGKRDRRKEEREKDEERKQIRHDMTIGTSERQCMCRRD